MVPGETSIAARLEFMLKMAALCHNEDASLIKLALAAGQHRTYLTSLIARTRRGLKPTFTIELAIKIEELSGGIVSREDLRPDVFER